MSMSGLSEKELLELQKKFKEGKFNEDEITEEQIKDLKDLYKKQIRDLEEAIEEDRKQILKILKK